MFLYGSIPSSTKSKVVLSNCDFSHKVLNVDMFSSTVSFKSSFPPSGLPRWLSSKESACSAGDTGSIPQSGRFPGRGNGNPLQYPCLKYPMDKGAW